MRPSIALIFSIKKAASFSAILLLLLLCSCSNGSNTQEMEKYIAEVKKNMQPSGKQTLITEPELTQSPISDFSSIEKRNPFDANAILLQLEKKAGPATNDFNLTGIVDFGTSKWAIIRYKGKSLRMKPGDALPGGQVISRITQNSVTISFSTPEGRKSVTLTLQEP